MGRGCRAVVVLGVLGLTAQCRALLGPDDARPPAPDGDAPDGVDDVSDDGSDDVFETPSRLDCDLRLQDCPSKLGCYPDDRLLGETRCAFKGAGGPLSPCGQQEDCDAGLICARNEIDPAARICVELCRPGADPSGCQVGVPCVPLPYYRVGICRY